jgi:tetratricopeptide (TPR) repeat protein
MTASESSSHQHSVVGTVILIFCAIVALSIADTFLARTESSENHAEAARLAAAGTKLLQQGNPLDAVAQFKAALAVERDHPEYSLALGQAQFAAGQLTDAEATLTGLLSHNSTAGAANLALARVLVKEGRITDAVSTYHRAIYGHWDANAEANRVNVRMELVNLLAQQGSKEELLAELLPLLDVAPDDVASRMKLANLFLVAGSAPRAGEIYREILRHHPQSPDAYAGLGESEFARGNYQTARGDFQAAFNLKPTDAQIQARLDLCNEILDLDPMRRGLPPEEQYRRSVKMLEIATAAIAPCTVPVEDQETMDNAQTAIKARPPARLTPAVESNLNLAEDLWKIRQKSCKRPPSPAEEPLRLVLAKIAQ